MATSNNQDLVAYLATIASIVFMTLAAATVCLFANVGHDLAQIVAALGFISAGSTGLIGIAGTFKGRQSGMSEETGKKILEKVPPTEPSHEEPPVE